MPAPIPTPAPTPAPTAAPAPVTIPGTNVIVPAELAGTASVEVLAQLVEAVQTSENLVPAFLTLFKAEAARQEETPEDRKVKDGVVATDQVCRP